MVVVLCQAASRAAWRAAKKQAKKAVRAQSRASDDQAGPAASPKVAADAAVSAAAASAASAEAEAEASLAAAALGLAKQWAARDGVAAPASARDVRPPTAPAPVNTAGGRGEGGDGKGKGRGALKGAAGDVGTVVNGSGGGLGGGSGGNAVSRASGAITAGRADVDLDDELEAVLALSRSEFEAEATRQRDEQALLWAEFAATKATADRAHVPTSAPAGLPTPAPPTRAQAPRHASTPASTKPPVPAGVPSASKRAPPAQAVLSPPHGRPAGPTPAFIADSLHAALPLPATDFSVGTSWADIPPPGLWGGGWGSGDCQGGDGNDGGGVGRNYGWQDPLPFSTAPTRVALPHS
jgi:hypothetical protein